MTTIARKMGRPPKGAEITVDKYKEALEASGGRRDLAARLLGVSGCAVTKAINKHPELQAIRDDYKVGRIERAQSVVDWAMSDDNPDPALRFRAAAFTLKTESEEHGARTCTVDISNPVNVAFFNTTFRWMTPDEAAGQDRQKITGLTDQEQELQYTQD